MSVSGPDINGHSGGAQAEAPSGEPALSQHTANVAGKSKAVPPPNPGPGPRGNKSDEPSQPPSPELERPELFINRELSWLEFNRRVLEEALEQSTPLLERVKFLSIFASNLDEFFMIRVSGLRQQMVVGALSAPPDGMTPAEQLQALRENLQPMLEEAARCWSDDLLPKLEAEGLHILSYSELSSAEQESLRAYFLEQMFPALTPLAFDPGHPFPHISNLSINLAVVVHEAGQGERFARLKVPPAFPRLLRVPEEPGAHAKVGLGKSAKGRLVWIEEVVAANLDVLFPGLDIVAAFPFRVTRDADFEIEEDEASDLLTTMEEVVGQRHFGFAVRLELDSRMPESMREILVRNLELESDFVYPVDGPIGKADVIQLISADRPDLKDAPFLPYTPPFLSTEEGIFSVIRRRDVMLFHPYDSFTPVVDFVREAARDPAVLTIKQTLYRVGPDSPVVEALMEARENGKQVAVLVELKARFDESNNIVWARALERAGVHVVYGVLGLKTHAKMCLVVRREAGGLRRYVHLGTGNYNPVTARIYTDLSYFSSDIDLASDVSDLFNALTGYSLKRSYRKLLVAPESMRDELLARIEREISVHQREGGGHLAFKLNSLVDKACIQALYRASQAGVRVDLQVRGICCLRPGLPGISENITVTSVVGRFLEHTRFLYFRNGGDEEMLIGSADLMPRNLDGRVEVLAPVSDDKLLRAMRDDLLLVHLEDNQQARRLQSDGSYIRLKPEEGEEPRGAQSLMLAHRAPWLPSAES